MLIKDEKGVENFNKTALLPVGFRFVDEKNRSIFVSLKKG